MKQKCIISVCLLTYLIALPALSATKRDIGFYVGYDHSAIHAERWNIKDANSGVEIIKFGYTPVDWLSIETRKSIYTDNDTYVLHDLVVEATSFSGSFLKFRIPINDMPIYLLGGHTKSKVNITVPDYPAEPSALEDLLDAIDAGHKLPDELRNMEPGTYKYRIDDYAYGIGLDLQYTDGRFKKWHCNLEYLILGDSHAWDWSLWTIGISRYF